VIATDEYCSAHTITESTIKGQIVCLSTAVKRQNRLRRDNIMWINPHWKSQSGHNNLNPMHVLRRENNKDKSDVRLEKKIFSS
jgi:hypothetical protein